MDFGAIFFSFPLIFGSDIHLSNITLLDFATKAYSKSSCSEIQSSESTKGIYCLPKSCPTSPPELDNSIQKEMLSH